MYVGHGVKRPPSRLSVISLINRTDRSALGLAVRRKGPERKKERTRPGSPTNHAINSSKLVK